jgi:hypothetical protein
MRVEVNEERGATVRLGPLEFSPAFLYNIQITL